MATTTKRTEARGGDAPDPYHYALVARALAHIRAVAPRRPTLAELAAAAGLSPAHFQRVFTRWAGVSPKRYQQYLTLDLARRLLRERRSLLETAAETGLSGPGRLHDLFLGWEAMSPGEYARRGAGLTIRHGPIATPYGPALLMTTPRGICGLSLTAETGMERALADMTRRWPKARFLHDPESIAPLERRLFGSQGGSAPGPLPLHLIGTPFRLKVWEALLALPEGHVTTYGALARRIGQPQAVRAVGTAVGQNPVALLIPCHRVLRSDGGLGGYHWGSGLKQAILLREALRTDAGIADGADDGNR